MNVATIRKDETRKENIILKTQTDPIAYKDKMEEIKDGEKGPPSPSWTLYGRSRFLTEAPMENIAKGMLHPKDSIPEWGEPLPEPSDSKAVEGGETSFSGDWWTEDTGEADPKETSSAPSKDGDTGSGNSDSWE